MDIRNLKPQNGKNHLSTKIFHLTVFVHTSILWQGLSAIKLINTAKFSIFSIAIYCITKVKQRETRHCRVVTRSYQWAAHLNYAKTVHSSSTQCRINLAHQAKLELGANIQKIQVITAASLIKRTTPFWNMLVMHCNISSAAEVFQWE